MRRRGIIALHSPWGIDWAACYFFGYREPWALPRGVIIAIAEIAEVEELSDEFSIDILRQHRNPLPQTHGSFALLLKDVRSLRKPVRCRGRQFLFPLDDKVASRVKELAGFGINVDFSIMQIDKTSKAENDLRKRRK